MPHYADGTPAMVGDIVRGNGYNESKNREIVGIVADVREGDSCTLSVVYTIAEDLPKELQPWHLTTYRDALLLTLGSGTKAYRLKLEYGDTKGFNKVG
jgi:hypothetical protein